MTAAGPMSMPLRMTCALVFGRAILRIGSRYVNYVLIDMIIVWMVQMSIVQIIDMPVMHNAYVSALCVVWMSMIFVLRRVTIGHLHSPLKDMN